MKKKLTIRTQSLLYAFIIFPFLCPEIFYFNSFLSKVLISWKVLVVVYSVYLLIKQKFKMKLQNVILILFLAEIILISLYNKVIPSITVYELAIVIIFSYFIDIDRKGFLKTIVIICEILIYINFITVILFPDGMYVTSSEFGEGYSANWFLGYKNPMIRLMLPACSFSYIYAEHYDKNRIIGSRILLIVSLITVILVKSSGGIMGLSVFILFLLSHKFQNKLSFLKVKMIYIAVIIIDIVIVLFRRQDIFNFIINNFLQRSSESLTGRTTIWDIAIELIKMKPIFGYGEASANVMHKYIYASHPHNYMLYIILQGGLVALVLFTIFIWISDSSLDKTTKNDPRLRCILLGTVAAFFVMGIAESLTGAILFYPVFTLFAADNDKKSLKGT